MTFRLQYLAQVNADTPPAIACWLAACITATQFSRPCFLHEIPERWFDARMLYPVTGYMHGIRGDWTW